MSVGRGGRDILLIFLEPGVETVLNAAFEAGQLSTSQRRGLIVVLYKKNDPLDTKNWRPISLLNVDYKIATRAISGRLLGVMSSIIGPDQTCAVRGRTISENLARVRDLLEYVEREDIPLALLSLDQEKAFDRVDWGFLLRILETFNFGPQFRNWVCLCYTDIQSAVIINGWMSSFFNPTRGVRQGCPLSPLLYVLFIEVLAECIRASLNIQGMTIPHSVERHKCSGYADDTTVAVTTEQSIEETFSVYSTYERASGAKLNRGKSKVMWAVPGRIVPIPRMGYSGSKNYHCSVRPSALVITPPQPGSQSSPVWRLGLARGPGNNCLFRGRQLS